MPNDGSTRMYTSGWPKIQNRCCHSSGSAPAATEKNVASNSRWNISRNSATVITGMANSSRNWIDEDHPREHRHAHQRHALGAHVERGDDQVDGAGLRGDAGDHAGRAPRSRCRCVGENGTLEFGAYMNQPPSAAPPRIHDELMNRAPNRKRPEAEGVDAGEGDVTGADLQRQEVVAEGGRHRHGEEEHHRRGVHGEHLVVEVRRQHRAVGRRPAGPGSAAPRCRRRRRTPSRDAVHDAELLVVDREQPTTASRWRRPGGGTRRSDVDGVTGAAAGPVGIESPVRRERGRSMMAIVTTVLSAVPAGRR